MSSPPPPSHLFQTDSFTIRRFTTSSSDSEDFFLFNGNPEATRFIRPAKSRAECEVFLRENIELYAKNDSAHPYFGRLHVSLRKTGEYVGVFSLLFLNNTDDPSVSPTFHIGFGFLPQFWGKGYASELLKFGTSFFFENTSFPSIFAITNPANVASEIVLGKNGYVLKGFLPVDPDDVDDTKLHLFQLDRA